MPAERTGRLPGASHAIGIDIGGTKIAAGLVGLVDGSVVERRSVRTDASDGGRPALEAAVALARELQAIAVERHLRLAGTGIGVPELVDRGGRILSNYNFRWAGLPIADRFSGLPAPVIDSDVRAAARAEARYGAGAGRRIVAYVTIGTGVSYSLCLDGEPYAGANGFAIHFASSALPFRCHACGSLEQPVVEAIASGPAMVRRYQELSGIRIDGGAALLARLDGGDAIAAQVVDDATHSLGGAIAIVVNMLDPEALVIGGGLGLAGGRYGEMLTTAIRQHIWAEAARDLPILPARLGADAGIVGAAAGVLAQAGLTAPSG
jgi:glucokinase